MGSRRNILGTAIAASLVATAAWALTQLEFSSPFELSHQTPGVDLAFKPKLVRLTNGWLVSVYGDAVDDAPARYAYDTKADALHPARDLFVRRCNAAKTDCADPENWSGAVNLSNTALFSSIDADWDGERDGSTERKPYYGDSEKPNVYGAGNRVVISWVDRYCPDGDVATPAIEPTVQRTVTYEERDNIEVPFGCLYTVASANGGADWGPPVQMSTGLRDAKQDVHRGLGSGHWALVWQEDPSGLKLGLAEGPGDGASGAKVAKGTDIWYAWADPGWADPDPADGLGFWRPPVRLTDNFTGQARSGELDIVREADGTEVRLQDMEGGIAGASRPNLALVDDSGRSGARIAVVAYEETKGSQQEDVGKFVRYHNFVWNQVQLDDPAGCLISDPGENSRRVRIVPQKGVGPVSGLRLGVFWRQGTYNQGGPSDIMLRFGYADLADKTVTGLEPDRLVPAVDAGCVTSDYAQTLNLANEPGLNLSSETPSATPANLADTTGQNNYEDARAHRAVLRGDDFYAGWTYTADWAVARYTDRENYNFWVRHFDGAQEVWEAPVNVSRMDDTSISVREPRLMGMPGSGPGCADRANPENPEDCQDKNTLVAAWGTETNVYDHIGGARDLEIYFTRTTDKAASFEPVVNVPGRGDNSRYESQLRPTPAGNVVYAVWGEQDSSSGAVRAMFAKAIAMRNEPPVAVIADPAPASVGEIVELDGSDSHDPEGDALSFHWTLDAPPGSEAVLSDPAAITPSFVADVEGVYRVVLVVNDGQLESSPATAAPSAEFDDPPVAEAGPDRTVEVGTRVTLDGRRSSDPEDAALTCVWTLSVPAGSRAKLSDTQAETPRFTADVTGIYTATLVVDDGANRSAPDTVSINAVPLGADLSISLSVADVEVRTKRKFSLDIGVTDAGPGEAHNVQISVTLPASLTAVGSDLCEPMAGGLSCTIPQMGAGSSGKASVTLYAETEGTKTITASLSSDMTDPDPANNLASVSLDITAGDSGDGDGGIGAMGWLDLVALSLGGLALVRKNPRRT